MGPVVPEHADIQRVARIGAWQRSGGTSRWSPQSKDGWSEVGHHQDRQARDGLPKLDQDRACEFGKTHRRRDTGICDRDVCRGDSGGVLSRWGAVVGGGQRCGYRKYIQQQSRQRWLRSRQREVYARTWKAIETGITLGMGRANRLKTNGGGFGRRGRKPLHLKNGGGAMPGRFRQKRMIAIVRTENPCTLLDAVCGASVGSFRTVFVRSGPIILCCRRGLDTRSHHRSRAGRTFRPLVPTVFWARLQRAASCSVLDRRSLKFAGGSRDDLIQTARLGTARRTMRYLICIAHQCRVKMLTISSVGSYESTQSPARVRSSSVSFQRD